MQVLVSPIAEGKNVQRNLTIWFLWSEILTKISKSMLVYQIKTNKKNRDYGFVGDGLNFITISNLLVKEYASVLL